MGSTLTGAVQFLQLIRQHLVKESVCVCVHACTCECVQIQAPEKREGNSWPSLAIKDRPEAQHPEEAELIH